ncbi:MAG: TetR/AcrR family transcriptional regulator [Eubacteriales bacterium]
MDHKTQDRRIRKTKKSLREGLAKLMLQKNLNEITVKELTDIIDLNRGTFYLHYSDIYDMVEKIENDLLLELQEIMDAHAPEQLNGKPLLLLEDVFTYLRDNAEMCVALLSNHGDIAFVNKLKEVVRQKCFKDWMTIYKSSQPDKYNYVYSFISSGCLGLFDTWLQNDLKETPLEMARLAENIILHGNDILK